jgi:hypothetical protein
MFAIKYLECMHMELNIELTFVSKGCLYTKASACIVTLISRLWYTTSIKKLKNEVGMAGPKRTKARFVGIITPTVHPYACFSRLPYSLKFSRFSRIRHRQQKFYPAKYSVHAMICGRGQPLAHSKWSPVLCESSRVVLISLLYLHVLLAILSDAVDIDIE